MFVQVSVMTASKKVVRQLEVIRGYVTPLKVLNKYLENKILGYVNAEELGKDWKREKLLLVQSRDGTQAWLVGGLNWEAFEKLYKEHYPTIVLV